jgi:hypothetical protein
MLLHIVTKVMAAGIDRDICRWIAKWTQNAEAGQRMKIRAAAAIRDEIRLGQAARAVLILAPLGLLAAMSGNELWLRAAVAGVSIYIGALRAQLTPLGALLHGLAILACFFALLTALNTPPLFVTGCAALAMAAIGLGRWGANFRSLGNWIFIPAVYLACETAEDVSPPGLAAKGLVFLPYVVAGFVPPLALCVYDFARARPAAQPWHRYAGRLLRAQAARGSTPYLAHALMAACAVGLAATLVEVARLGHGQWVIWSAASVVTGDWASAQRKLRQRAAGACLGVPIGAAIGVLLPHDGFVFGFAALGAIVTLVAFKTYIVEFTARCAFTAVALVAVAGSAAAAASRVDNVLLGGAIGVLTVYLGHLAGKARAGAG